MIVFSDLALALVISVLVFIGCFASISCCLEVDSFRKEMKELDASIKHWEKLKAALDEEDRRHVLPYD